MTVYEILNIEHCTVTPMFNGGMFKIEANPGWYICLHEETEGDDSNVTSWTTLVFLQSSYNFAQIEILAEEDLPEGAEIHGNTDEPEVM